MAGSKRLVALVSALGAGALLAAAAFAAPGEPRLAVKQVDQASARTLLLRKSELPGKGWNGSPLDFDRSLPLCIVKHYSLARLTATGQAGTEYGRDVDTGTFLVDTSARVYLTPAQASAAVAIRSKLGVGKCFGQALASEVPNGSFANSTSKVFSIRGLALPSKGFKITIHVVTGKQKSTLTAVILDFRRGRTVNSLNVLTVDNGWSNETLRSVAALIAKRTAKS